MTSESDRWYDDAAGPVVRPYAMTRGRTSHAAEAKLDLIALVMSQDEDPDAAPGRAARTSVAGIMHQTDWWGMDG